MIAERDAADPIKTAGHVEGQSPRASMFGGVPSFEGR